MSNYSLEEWNQTVAFFEERFGEGIELDGILFVIGVHELGQGFKIFEKDEKLNLMHIAVCTLLGPLGYFKKTHLDADGWPHFERSDNLPELSKKDQENLLKQAIITYSRKVLQ